MATRRYGKPVGQYGIEFCDKLLAAVAFALRNADGQGDFFDGFPPDCAAPDDADHQLGDPEEAIVERGADVCDHWDLQRADSHAAIESRRSAARAARARMAVARERGTEAGFCGLSPEPEVRSF